MLHRSIDNNQNTPNTTKKSFTFSQHHYQHGAQFSILLAFPSESLTHITCFLDPPTLLALSRTNKYLNKHVEDDNTWHRAFVCQFLGISPECDLQNAKTLMLRRCESSWKKEFIIRYNLRRRWERSRNTTVTHTPHHSAVTGMHLMPEAGLLTSSIQYGIVSRSLPISGKILRGFLDTSGTGLGIGNPNAEFTPNVSTCALSSDGGTAKIVWGFQTGEVALITANRVMDNGRAAAKLTRCKIDDEHDGSVQHVVWVPGENAFVTGALDGRVKLWDAKRVKCIWASEEQNRLVADPCEKVAALGNFIVSAMKSGEIYLWAGLETVTSQDAAQSAPHCIVSEIRIPTPIRTVTRNEWEGDQVTTTLHLVDSSPSQVSILTAYANHSYFYRLRVNVDTGFVESTQFGTESFGFITAIEPYFSNGPEESSFVIAGDQLGCVSVYDWNASSLPEFSNGKSPSLRALHKFEAHEDGSVTAIAWNSITLVTGSSRGTVKVWDSLTFTALRCFSSPAARPPVGGEWDIAGHIILKRDLLVVSVGSRVLAWKAGPVSHRGPSMLKGKHAKKSKKSGPAKGYHQFELHRDITESRQELDDEQAYLRRACGREKEQRSTLDDLGLDEIEAVEYILMLSRDEEEARSMGQPSVSMEEGVFEGDFDDVPTRVISVPASSSYPSSSGLAYNSDRSLPRTSPRESNHKVQVSPHFRPEPMEAVSSSSVSMNTPVVLSLSPDHFPPISPSTSNPGTPETRRSVSGSPGVPRSAWSSPRRSAPPSEVSSPGSMSPLTYRTESTGGIPGSVNRSASSGSFLLSTDMVGHPSANVDASDVSALRDEMDEDIRFAIELSLIEARSRGENV